MTYDPADLQRHDRWRALQQQVDLPVISRERPAWFALAACRGTGVADFFASSTYAAEAVCRRCDARDDCLAYALADPSLTGVWGCTTEAERRELRRRGRAT